MRIYYNKTANQKLIDYLSGLDLELIQIDLPYGPMFYRIFPAMDHDVYCFISRDLDSIVSFREAEMVKIWLEGEWHLHLIHEVHPGHRHVIMGGMFGLKTYGKTDDQLVSKIRDFNVKRNKKQFRYLDDQRFFQEYLGRHLNKKNCIDHNKIISKTGWSYSQLFNIKCRSLSSLYSGMNERFVGHRVDTKQLYQKHFGDPLTDG